jgi:hypothetical protein
VGIFAFVRFLSRFGFCESFSLESLVHSDFKAVAKRFLANTLSSSFNTFPSALHGHVTPWTFVFSRGEVLWSFVECFAVSVHSSLRVLQLLYPFCPAHKFLLSPIVTLPSPPPTVFSVRSHLLSLVVFVGSKLIPMPFA